MSFVPGIPGRSVATQLIIENFAGKLAKEYLKQMKEQFQFDWEEFSKWTVVMSMLRICYGLPSEKEARIQYVKKCCQFAKQGIDAATWYESL